MDQNFSSPTLFGIVEKIVPNIQGLGEFQNGCFGKCLCFVCTFAFPLFLIFWSVLVGGYCELSEYWGVLYLREWL